MIQWEYRVERIGPEGYCSSRAGLGNALKESLCGWGLEGWELCSLYPGSPDSIAVVLKRPMGGPNPSAGFDPIRDETKEFGLQEWADALCQEVQKYAQTFKDVNDYHVQPHRWSDWMGSFARYMSW